jgi:hypothetical protein
MLFFNQNMRIIFLAFIACAQFRHCTIHKSLTNSMPVSRAAEITDSQFSGLNQHDWAH